MQLLIHLSQLGPQLFSSLTISASAMELRGALLAYDVFIWHSNSSSFAVPIPKKNSDF